MRTEKPSPCHIPPLAVSELNALDEYLNRAWQTGEEEGWHVIRSEAADGHRLWVKLEWAGELTKESAYLEIDAALPCNVSLSCRSDYIPAVAPEAFWQCRIRFTVWQAS